MTRTQPLRDEHAELYPHVEALATAGDAVGSLPLDELLAKVDDSYQFLAEHLIPHAHAEEAVLYPVVGRLVGAVEATSTMERDHVEVATLTEELAALRARLATVDRLDDELTSGLRRVLYGLHAVVKVHFAKEEEVFLPILDAKLTDADAAALFAAMDHAGHGHL
jgi:iron-sulfur cluster repair protein YtfE (RIC family)